MAAPLASTPLVARRHSGGFAAQRRLGVALCASTAFHAWLSATVPGAAPAPFVAALPVGVVSARIQTPEGVPSAPGFEIGPPLSRSEGRGRDAGSNSTEHNPGEHRAKSGPTQASARANRIEPDVQVPLAADSTWYTALELDTYPRTSTPIRIGPVAHAAAGDTPARRLLWLRIDEHGTVVEMTAGEPGIPARWMELARAGIAGIRFTPARKDDRMVKARLLVSVDFTAEAEP